MTAFKSFTPAFKAAEADGTASWVMARLNVVDLDGDVTLPGAFGRQHFAILPAHDASHVPLGKASLAEVGDEAVVEARFNLAIPAARDWHAAIMFDLAHPPAVQEYSYAYSLREGGAAYGDLDGRRVRYFRPLPDGSPGLDVLETSPVLRGAGVGTRTLAAKDRHDPALLREFCRFVAANVAHYGAVDYLASAAVTAPRHGGSDGRVGAHRAPTERPAPTGRP